MRILVAEDDSVCRKLLEAALVELGHEVHAVEDGQCAWTLWSCGTSFDVVITDWLMPHIDGIELCRRIRLAENHAFCYVLLLTAKDETEDLVEGLLAGADDFMTKPFDPAVLRARLQGAERVVTLERKLASKVRALEQALDEVKTLRGLLPICMYCKSIRDEGDVWGRMEKYIAEHSEANFTHSVCPDCYEKQVGPMLRELAERNPAG